MVTLGFTQNCSSCKLDEMMVREVLMRNESLRKLEKMNCKIGVAIFVSILVSSCSLLRLESMNNSLLQTRKKNNFSLNNQSFKLYDEECAACHVGYVPAFLPERSWAKLINDLENHFGQNAELDDGSKALILAYLKRLSADSSGASAASKRLALMIPADEVPIRITETPFWRRRHGSVKAYVWKRSKVQSRAKCDVCHQEAAKGVFNEKTARIPK